MASSQQSPRADKILGSLEYQVLTVLWASSPASVDTVRTTINKGRKDQLAYTTIMTVLSRLHEKDFLDRNRVGRAFEYSPRFTEPELVAHVSHTQVNELVARYGDVALAQFASALEDATPETLQRISDLARGDDHAS